MKIKNIHLTNFKRISNNPTPTMVCNEDVNILVGANNSGKTSILQAFIGLFKIEDVLWQKTLAYQLKGKGQIGVSSVFQLNQDEWKNLIAIQATTQKSFLQLLTDDNLKLLADRDIILKQTIDINNYKVVLINRLCEFDASIIKNKTLANSLNKFIKNLGSIDFYDAFSPILYLTSTKASIHTGKETFIAENTLKNNRVAAQNPIAKLFYLKKNDEEAFITIKKEILDIFQELKDFDVIFDIQEGIFELKLTENIPVNGHSILVPYDVADVGLGMQNVLIMLANILLLKPSVVFMDEPDAHMHPSLVHEFMKIISRLSNKTQFFMTTHSIPLMESVELNKLFNLTYKPETKGSIIKNVADKEGFLEAIEALGYDVSHFIYAQKPAVYVFTEGASDSHYVLKFAALLGASHVINPFSVCFIALGGKGDRFKLAKLIEKLNKDFVNKPLLLLLDRDETTKEQIALLAQSFNSNPKRLFYLSKRQIENYLLDLKAIKKIGQKRLATKPEQLAAFNALNLEEKFLELAELQRDKILDNYLEDIFINQSILTQRELRALTKQLSTQPLGEAVNEFGGNVAKMLFMKINLLSHESQTALEIFAADWSDPIKKIEKIDGRVLLKTFRQFCEKQFSLSFSNDEIIENITVEDVHDDIKALIDLLREPEQLISFF